MTVDEFVNQDSPLIRKLKFLSGAWLERLRAANGPVDERTYLSLMAITSDIRYLEMIGEQRNATKLRWTARRWFEEAGLKWVRP
jgi:hypothetical protein